MEVITAAIPAADLSRTAEDFAPAGYTRSAVETMDQAGLHWMAPRGNVTNDPGASHPFVTRRL